MVRQSRDAAAQGGATVTEGEILSIRNELTALVISVVSVSFGMISAYIVGLWLFLKDSPFGLRALAFALLSCGLAFMGVLTGGLNALLVGTERAWSKLSATSVGITSFSGARLHCVRGDLSRPLLLYLLLPVGRGQRDALALEVWKSSSSDAI
jgi:hypothetical protein